MSILFKWNVMNSKERFAIRVSYEPDRLAEVYLLDAYTKLMPVLKYSVNANKKELQGGSNVNSKLICKSFFRKTSTREYDCKSTFSFRK
ncbi:hypothetical protein Wcon_00344 [Wolbachia endosymbiont of Cylisticus convexus]|nr:hypothetical protein Wcon_02240 [Wolbachia endosymbiont of Cylisticus convexus]RDD33835.1 hypothetical protein Wcon_02145 [Wolbachia endosymbiont of Cylisticus convexus]RDD33846.1 hypothetical protein Wcon_02129 [Wolbachia endosymbiont of Cylisticus convexus]RDD33895.1 hypothetical protein Wcon_02078 [Wolbachia endosymbiont of Cylisticus convexus]RDD33943.1 hypothetical protein Wcon_02036 [Wolbachia endosymbiont of Cylisticus convexus]